MSAPIHPIAALRALTAMIVLSASLSGCLVVENPPSPARACDPALVGDWGLIEGEAILGSIAPAAADAEFTDDDDRRLRIDAQCRAHLSAKYQPRQLDVQVFKADGHRYLGLSFFDVAVLLTGAKGAQDLAGDKFSARFPHALSLLRYQTGPDWLILDAGNTDQLKRVLAQRDSRAGVARADAPDLLMGDTRQIRKQLREHPGLFEAPDRSTLYRFKRIPAAAR